MENQLRCVMFNREEFLIEHQLDADVLFLLEGLYQYGVRVLNLDGKPQKRIWKKSCCRQAIGQKKPC